MAWHLTTFEQDTDLCRQLAADISACLKAAIAVRGSATLAVSGGSTPIPLFKVLSTCELQWSAVTVTLVDERWLAPEHADANAGLVQQHLLQGPAAAATFLPLYIDGVTASAAQPEVDRRLATLAWPLDVVVLGMGGDGHTASLFPGSATLQSALDGLDSHGRQSRCCAVTPVTAPHDRMTLTLPAILDSESLFLHTRGSDKRRVLEQAMQPGPVKELPVRAVLHSAASLQLFCSNN